MAGVTDLSFRLICRQFGAKVCFFEMIDANALVRQHKTTPFILDTNKKDKPIAAQLLGRDPQMMLDAAHRLMDLAGEVSFLDINSGCPAKKVISKKCGAYLLEEPETLAKILKKMKAALSIPITVKIRLSDKGLKESINVAKTCQENGAARLFVHGRTMLQGYAGEVNYGAIKAIKEALEIPVFGSGNIFNPVSAKRMIDETGCDGILAARGALGNPWIFTAIDNYLKNGTISPLPGLLLRKKVLKKHLRFVENYKRMRSSNKAGFMGKIAMWYLKGLPRARQIRAQIGLIKTHKDLMHFLETLA